MEQLHITTFTARRCTYDLAHATSFMGENDKWRDNFQSAAKHYQNIFTPWGGKEYRLELHGKLYDLDNKVSKLEKLCKDNNIELPYDEMPF